MVEPFRVVLKATEAPVLTTTSLSGDRVEGHHNVGQRSLEKSYVSVLICTFSNHPMVRHCVF